jgi:hypothetical protein
MVNPEDKGLYKLWWEYLKRSERYKDFLRENKEKNFYAEALKSGVNKPLFFTAHIFGDVHNQSFAQWWKRERNRSTARIKGDPHHPIKDAMDEFLFDVRQVYGQIGMKRELEPESIQASMDFVGEDELVEALREHMNSLTGWGIERIEVNSNAPMEELAKEFRRYLSQKRKDEKAREFAMKLRGIKGKPTKEKLKDELQRYLDVYDLRKKGLTFPQIIRKIGTPAQRESIKAMRPLTKKEEKDLEGQFEGGQDTADIIRMYRRDLQKAKNIIDNVGQVHFPGNYETARR